MYFTQQQSQKPAMAQHLPRMMFVALLHVLVFFMIAQSMGMRVISKAVETVTHVETLPEPTPTPTPVPPQDVKPKQVTVNPPVIPTPAVDIDPPPAGPGIRAHYGEPTHQPTGVPTATPTPTPPVVLAKHEPVRVKAVIEGSACAKPEYPKNSARNDEQGTVLLGFLVGTDGRVMDSRVDKSSGFKDLDKAARQALSLCKFKPGTVDGVPQETWASLQYVWQIE